LRQPYGQASKLLEETGPDCAEVVITLGAGAMDAGDHTKKRPEEGKVTTLLLETAL